MLLIKTFYKIAKLDLKSVKITYASPPPPIDMCLMNKYVIKKIIRRGHIDGVHEVKEVQGIWERLKRVK